MDSAWRFAYHPSPSLPPLAWVARVDAGAVHVACGTSVRHEAGGFFEGTWIGPPGVAAIVDSTTPFGTGMVVAGGELFIVPPGHTLSSVYSHRAADGLLVSNSLVALLVRADLRLRTEFDYTSRFRLVANGLSATPIELPTSRGPVMAHFFENLRVTPELRIETVAKRREKPFTSFSEYIARLDAGLALALANAPAYEPVIALSNGYDSPAVAVIAARHGCRRALTFATARPPVTTRDASDSGEHVANRLGMEVEFFDRTEYTRRDDLPEAEFLATGYTGEEVALVAMEPALQRKVLLTGGLGGAMWLRGKEPHHDLRRKDYSACSMTEFRLRADFVDLPISIMGMTEIPSLVAISNSDEMRPWSVGGYYDKPIPRRILEEAGFARGSFATAKRAATALIHQQGERVMAPATVASVRAFAAAEGTTVDLGRRRRPSRYERGLVRVARRMRAARVVQPLADRERAIVHHAPRTGTILFRWAVEQLRPRYADLRRDDGADAPG